MSFLRTALAVVSLAAPLARADVPAPQHVEPVAAYGVLPTACRPFTVRYADARDETFRWNQRLSLAGCLQDASMATVANADELAALLDELNERLVPAMLVDLEVLEHAPTAVQAGAAFEVAMANVSLIVRMRASIVRPDSPLHATVEDLLDHAKRTAWLSFALIDRAATAFPSIAADPVGAYEVRYARSYLAELPRPPALEVHPALSLDAE